MSLELPITKRQNFLTLKEVLFILFIGLLGLAPHLVYSWEIGHLSWMETSWDENTYASHMLSGRIEAYRIFSSLVFKFFYSVFGGSLSWAMISLDVFASMICAALACVLVRLLGFKRFLVPASLLLFSVSFLSFSDVNFWGGWLRYVSPFVQPKMVDGLQMFIPNVTISFYTLFRSPDPQCSLAVLFGFFILLLRYDEKPVWLRLLPLVGVMAVFPFIYVSIGISALVFMVGYAVLSLALHRRHGVLLAAGVVGLVWYAAFFLIKTGEGNAVTLMYHSRLPVMAPSMFWSMAGCAGIIWYGRHDLRKISARVLMAFAAFALPLVTLNQQIITGLMVQSRNWEFYANYSYIALGLLLVFPYLPSGLFHEKLSRFGKYIPVILVISLIVGQARNYDRFDDRNLQAEAFAQAVTRLGAEGGLGDARILLAQPEAEAAVLNVLPETYESNLLPGHRAMMRRIGSEGGKPYRLEDMPYRYIPYTLYSLEGKTTEDFSKKLDFQIGRGTCDSVLLYFFDVMDCSGVMSDYRALKQDKLRAIAPDLVADYGRFLADPQAGMKNLGNLVYLTTKPLEKYKDIMNLEVGRFKRVTVYAYLL